ncbi:MAG: hypothetical protein KBH07_04825 [Flavobacteriales bacterium]|nr:hypothetical protein [Flavobacteriales bacterium]
MTDVNPSMSATPARPTLLTVICILSFIMGAWGIFSGFQNLVVDQTVALDKARVEMEQARADLGEQASGLPGKMLDSAMDLAEKTAANATPIGISTIVLSLISLFGVWQMWNLRKNGFWLYVLSSVAGLATTVYFLGGSMVAILSVGFAGFFSLVFIILYAVNLKHMH